MECVEENHGKVRTENDHGPIGQVDNAAYAPLKGKPCPHKRIYPPEKQGVTDELQFHQAATPFTEGLSYRIQPQRPVTGEFVAEKS